MTMLEHAWIGVDPGLRGAVALLPQSGPVEVVDYPGDARRASQVLQAWLIGYDIDLVAIEAATSRPGQGVRSVFTFGRSFGEWLGILAVLGVPHVLVPPRQWQRGMVRPSDGPDPKSRSLAVARRLFPDIDLHRKKDYHRSDALLLAYWAKRGGAR
jgi:hypothetical protein